MTVDLLAAGGFDAVLMLFAPHGDLVAENGDYEGSPDPLANPGGAGIDRGVPGMEAWK